MKTRWMRLLACLGALAIVAGACGGSGDGDETVAEEPTATTAPEPEPEPEPEDEPAEEPAPEPEPAEEPEPEPEDEPEEAFEPPTSIMLDDPALSMEPADVAYRAQLFFSMRAELADGSVEEATVMGDGGKLLPDTDSMVIAVEGPTTIPGGCLDIAALTPNYTSAYFTFSGGLSGDDGGDLMGEAFLFEPGITTNGVLADRYEITLANIDADDSAEYVTFDDAYIDIAREGGHVVRITLSGTGTNNTFAIDQSEPREIMYELNFSEFGEMTEFTPPPGCGSDEDEGALTLDGTTATVAWDETNPVYIPAAGGADPFFHIHTSNDLDGFFLSFELYTVWGEAWTGQTGTFPIACQNPATDTGICVHLDPDGPGPAGNLGADFGATGTVTINQLDDSGYSIDVEGLTFTDGTTFAPFTMAG